MPIYGRNEPPSTTSCAQDIPAREAVSAVTEAAEQNVATGVLLLCKEALITAIQDSRLHRGHLRLLAAVVSFMNSKTAKAWPGRASASFRKARDGSSIAPRIT